jgi:hypothetical protein
MDLDPTDLHWMHAVMREQAEYPPPDPGEPDPLSPADRYALRLRNAITLLRTAGLDPLVAGNADMASKLGQLLMTQALREGRITITDPRWDEPLLFVHEEWERVSATDRTPLPLRSAS